MSKSLNKSSSRRSRRRRAQGSKATAEQKLATALNVAKLLESRQPPRRVKRGGVRRSRGMTNIVSDRIAQGNSYSQSAVAGVGSSLTHQFNYSHFETKGTKGVRCSGISPTRYFSYASSSYPWALQSFSLGTITATIPVNPAFLFPSNSNELLMMFTFAKFRFTKLKLVYVTSVNTSVIGSIIFGYYPDGALVSGDVTAAFMYATPGTITAPVWSTNVGTDVTQFLDTTTWFYVDTDVATDAGLRLSEQGDILGIWGIAPAYTQSYGILYLDYEVELIEPRSNVDLALLSQEERMLRHEFSKLRLQEEKERVLNLFLEYKKRKGKVSDGLSDGKSPVGGGFGGGDVKKELVDPVFIVSEGSRMGETYVFQSNPSEVKIPSSEQPISVTTGSEVSNVLVVNASGTQNIPVAAPDGVVVEVTPGYLGSVTIDDQPIEVTVVPSPSASRDSSPVFVRKPDVKSKAKK